MIRLQLDGPVGWIILSRPERRNALTPGMLREIEWATAQLGAQARCIVLAGDGPAFCAGFDLSLCQQDPAGAVMRSLLTGLSIAIRTLRRAGAPVIAAAHGAAIAGGCALLGGADVVVTDRRAKLGYPVVRLGISPAVSAPFLQEAVAGGPAREHLLDPNLFSGEHAAAVGLAHELLDEPGDVRPRAAAIAAAIAAKPPGAINATRRWLDELAGPSADAAQRGLAASLSLTGGDEERDRLAELWRKS